MFHTRVCILLVFIFFLHTPFLSDANKLPTPNSPVDNISVYNKYSNTDLLSQDSDPTTPKQPKGLSFGRGNTIATGLILVITLLNIIVYKLRVLQEANLTEELNSPSSLPSEWSCRCFSLAEILSATNNFSDKLVLGRGGFGKVYKGFIDNGTVTVAIKRLNHMSKQGPREFWNEIEMLSKFRHSHLVSLIGYCNIGKEMIIVYEYMVHGTLADHLHKNGMKGSNGNSTLSWVQRLKICIGAARGLDYLHTGTGVIDRVIHRDVKSSNILLDKNWAARVSDFGMSKIGPANTLVTHVSTNVKGTFGYVDPEYFLTRKLTRKSDVYSFGVVLFEVLCGRPVIDLRLDDEQRGLAGWAQQNVKEGTVDQIIDPSLRGQILSDSLKKFEQIADQCLHMFSKNRPTMAEVVVSLELALTLQERVEDSFVFEDFFTENQKNPNSLTAQEGIIDLINDLHEEVQMGEIVQPGDAIRSEHHRAKPIKNRELLRIVRQGFLGMAQVISGNKFPEKAKRTSQQLDAKALVRRVPFFEQMDDQLRDAICERLVSSLSTKDTYIVREGDPVNEMLFVIRGVLDSSTTNGRSGFFNSSILKAGDFCGEELLTWVLTPTSPLNLPYSTRTIKSLTKVEAFALRAVDLKFVIELALYKHFHNNKLQHAFRWNSYEWRTWGACFIQASWRRYKRKKLATQESLYYMQLSDKDDEDGADYKASSTWSSREEKVNIIFQHFDANRDGGLGPEEMAALIVAVNPRVEFSDDQINAIVDEVFRVYDEYIDGEKGLTFNGLLSTYDNGDGDPDCDFELLGFEL